MTPMWEIMNSWCDIKKCCAFQLCVCRNISNKISLIERGLWGAISG